MRRRLSTRAGTTGLPAVGLQRVAATSSDRLSLSPHIHRPYDERSLLPPSVLAPRKQTVMPTSYTRHRVEIPLDLFHALNRAAADAGMPTSALITVWLLRMLEDRRPDLHVRDPYRSGVDQHERRPRRADELPDNGPFTALFPAVPDNEDDLDAAHSPAPLTTVTLQPQEGAILPMLDPLPTQS